MVKWAVIFPSLVAAGVIIFMALVGQYFHSGTLELDKAGGMQVSVGSFTKSLVLVNPNGGEESTDTGEMSPWISTLISVKKGDRLQFSASGRVNLAVHRLVEYADLNRPPPIPWTGPKGLPDKRENMRWADRERSGHFLALERPRGALLGAIAESTTKLPKTATPFPGSEKDVEWFVIGDRKTITATVSGILHFTVNEMWLDKENGARLFAPELPKSSDEQAQRDYAEYYINWLTPRQEQIWASYVKLIQAKPEEGFQVAELPSRRQLFNDCKRAYNDDPRNQLQAGLMAAEIARSVKRKIYKELIADYPRLYFDDNGGAFVVTIDQEGDTPLGLVTAIIVTAIGLIFAAPEAKRR